MASLRQYFDTDFSGAVRLHVKLFVSGQEIEAAVLYDFSAYTAFLACYVPNEGYKSEFYSQLLQSLVYGDTPLEFCHKVTLPSAKGSYQELKIENKEDFEVQCRFGQVPNVGVTSLTGWSGY